ncbi:TolC family protein [Muribaculum intestinale]|uniref:TolC family protein n=1 Tax=Muribaculum intestinale TaxID=1796646 RepID=UPI00109363BA|nr:TolC family protein [Muribaculum intestinale]TGX86958.1 TolC family protein [Muribaculum intestinale]
MRPTLPHIHFYRGLKAAVSLALIASSATMQAQMPEIGGETVSLDSCRAMAMANNKQLRIQAEQIRAAGYQKKEAFAAYLPQIDFAGGYVYNSNDINILGADQHLPIMNFDGQGYTFDLVTNPATGLPLVVDGKPVPKQVAYLPKSAMSFDMHNVFFGAVTLTQPIFMGGKIVAMNKITGYAEELAKSMHENGAQDIIYAVDAAYWQVVSLNAKKKLAVSYVALLDTLHRNVQAMIDQGVATRSDLLTVNVKLNAANVDLVKVENGLSLSRMALAQICGLPVNTQMALKNEYAPHTDDAPVATTYNMPDVYSRRQDLHALELGIKIADQQSKIAMSSMLPTAALIGSYTVSNPNMNDGFEKKFGGSWHIGGVIRIPLWHWGGNYNKYRAARTQANIMRLRLEDAKEMVDLQVSQAAYKAREAMKTYDMTRANLRQADENLRQAQLGFKAGVQTTDNVMEAQTAWLKANSENIDAEIDVCLCRVYLSKVLGTLEYPHE